MTYEDVQAEVAGMIQGLRLRILLLEDEARELRRQHQKSLIEVEVTLAEGNNG